MTTPDAIPAGWRILDVGPQTMLAFGEALGDAATVIWNGTLGVAEFPAFAQGTDALIAHAGRADRSRVRSTIVGGGDSAAAVEADGAADKLTHVSTGGGASLEFLEGRELPGVAALRDREASLGDTTARE